METTMTGQTVIGSYGRVYPDKTIQNIVRVRGMKFQYAGVTGKTGSVYVVGIVGEDKNIVWHVQPAMIVLKHLV